MEIIKYIAEDGFEHMLLYPTMGINFTLWIILIGASIGFIYLIFKKILGA